VPTVLFEAGHYANDYGRDQTRFYLYVSLILAFKHIQLNAFTGETTLKDYQSIPLNQKCFYDIIFRNVSFDDSNTLKDVAIQYKEVLMLEEIRFKPEIVKIGSLSDYFGHKEINAQGRTIETHLKKPVYEGYENDFVLMKNEKISILP
jgi:hypothetical protein